MMNTRLARLLASITMGAAISVAVPAMASASGLTQPPRAVVLPPVVDVDATPAGWIPVDDGDAQISVPATWTVAYHSMLLCMREGPGQLIVNPASVIPMVICRPQGPLPATHVRLWTYKASGAVAGPEQLVNGIPVYGTVSNNAGDVYAPALGVGLSWQGVLGLKVLDTLTWSPRAVVLAQVPPPTVPLSWQTVSYAGLTFSVPAAWPVTRADWILPLGYICRPSGVAEPADVVTLSTDRRPLLVMCPRFPLTPLQPGTGVQVDVGHLAQAATLGFSPSCLHINGLKVCVAGSPAYSILVLKVMVPGRSRPVYVSIGTAGDGTTARAILYSLR